MILNSGDEDGAGVKLEFIDGPTPTIISGLRDSHWLVFPHFHFPTLKHSPVFYVKLLDQANIVLPKNILLGLVEGRHYPSDFPIDFYVFGVKVIIGLVVVLLEGKCNRE